MTKQYNYRAIENQWGRKVSVCCGCEDTDIGKWRAPLLADIESRYQAMQTHGICSQHLPEVHPVCTEVYVKDWVSGLPVLMNESNENVICPTQIAQEYGFDSLRLYVAFAGPSGRALVWDEDGLEGVYRFVNRFYRMVMDSFSETVPETQELAAVCSRMVGTVSERMERSCLHTAAAGLMEAAGRLKIRSRTTGGLDAKTRDAMILLIAPFTPCMAEDLWQQTGHDTSVFSQNWPSCGEENSCADRIRIPVQVNGKVRVLIEVSSKTDQAEAEKIALQAMGSRLTETVLRTVYIPGRVINLVTETKAAVSAD